MQYAKPVTLMVLCGIITSLVAPFLFPIILAVMR